MTTRTELKTKMQWMKIPAGTLRMGSSLEEVEKAHEDWIERLLEPRYQDNFRDWLMKEYPKHEVELDAFEISDILVTNEMYRQFCEATGTALPESLTNPELGGGDDHPAWGMDFDEAKAYCRWLTEAEGSERGETYVLPTEAQWEYAARGTGDVEYPWGDEFAAERCNTFEAGIGRTTPVRQYENGRSASGLYDLGGNVEEWVDSMYVAYPGGQWVADDLVEALGDVYPVLRGGSFARGGDLARNARRHGGFPDPVFRFTGFRLVRIASDLKSQPEEESHHA